MNTLNPPVKKTIRGSHFPKLPTGPVAHHYYEVCLLDDTIVYAGYSEPVARLVNACMTPRAY